MTSADARALGELADLADRIAADCRSILRRRGLACDSRRLSLARPALLVAHREVLWSFVPDFPQRRNDGREVPACEAAAAVELRAAGGEAS